MKKHKVEKPELQSWYKDRYQHLLIQRKLLGVITLAALGCSLLLLFIIFTLIPQKSIEPYVIQVDPKTGITQTVNPLTAQELTANEAVNNYFIVQYIRSREGYNPTDLAFQYNLVRLMSDSRKVYQEFMNAANPNNPDSNVARLGAFGLRTVKVKSITYLSPQVAQVRVMITERKDKPFDRHQIILVAFEYVKMSLASDDRYLNPLGFRVTDYQVTEDTVQQ